MLYPPKLGFIPDLPENLLILSCAPYKFLLILEGLFNSTMLVRLKLCYFFIYAKVDILPVFTKGLKSFRTF